MEPQLKVTPNRLEKLDIEPEIPGYKANGRVAPRSEKCCHYIHSEYLRLNWRKVAYLSVPLFWFSSES